MIARKGRPDGTQKSDPLEIANCPLRLLIFEKCVSTFRSQYYDPECDVLVNGKWRAVEATLIQTKLF